MGLAGNGDGVRPAVRDGEKRLAYLDDEGDLDTAKIDADIRTFVEEHADELPDGWDRHPPGDASLAFGDTWLRSRVSVALRVPSVVVPEGSNYVLNPEHPDFAGTLTIHAAVPLQLDPRILERFQSD